MEIQVKYELNTKVLVKELNIKGSVCRIGYDRSGLEYQIRYFYNGEIKYVCSSSYNNAGVYDNMVKCKKTKVVYQNEPVYKNVTYYRSRSKTLKNSVDTKWSNCDDDTLIKEGYVKTGKED